MESFNQRNSLQPLLQRDRIENSSKRDFFPLSFLLTSPSRCETCNLGGELDSFGGGGGGAWTRGNRPVLRFQLYPLKLPAGELASVMAQLTGGEKLQSVGNCFIPFPARTQYRASLTRASTFKDFHLSQRWIPTTRGTEGQFFFPNALIPFLVIPIFPSVDITILFIISRREEWNPKSKSWGRKKAAKKNE